MSEQSDARDAIYREITRQTDELGRAMRGDQQAEALLDLARAYAHLASTPTQKPAAQTAKTSGNSRDW